MKAMVYTQYGSPEVLRLQEVAQPTPKADEVLVQVQAVSLNVGDLYLLKGQPFLVRLMGGGLQKPKNTILGGDIAGRVTAVGRQVTRFKPGDAVFGNVTDYGAGGFAEYVCAPEKALALKPARVTFEHAAASALAAATALRGLRAGGLQAGQTVLIHGASGGVGSFAVQIAKALGAEVTAVCSARNVDMARSIGADHVIDYTREDFTQNGQRYNLILAVNGNRSIFEYQRALKPQGVCVVAGGSMRQIFQGMLLGPLVSRRSRQKVRGLESVIPTSDELAFLAELLVAGKIQPVIDQTYPLSQTAAAFRYLEDVHARGKVVIAVGG